MYQSNFFNDSNNRKVLEAQGNYKIVEYQKDLSVNPQLAATTYFMSQMNIRKRQLLIDLTPDNGCIVQAGSMHWMVGNIEAATNIKGVGDFLGKALASTVTKETTIKPRYITKTSGSIVLEPTYKHLLIENVADWEGGMVIEDGMFLACDDTINIKTVARNTFSSAALGKEGLFNSMLIGNGYAVLESNIPRDELVLVELKDDQLKIDGSFAIAWSQSLKFTVERTTKTLIGSAATKEGLVNTYRGTGKILMAPVI